MSACVGLHLSAAVPACRRGADTFNHTSPCCVTCFWVPACVARVRVAVSVRVGELSPPPPQPHLTLHLTPHTHTIPSPSSLNASESPALLALVCMTTVR